MSVLDLRTIARRLGGEISGRQVLAPGPGHSPGDRSLSIRLSPQSPTGFIVFSHSGDDFRVSRDYVAERLGLGSDCWRRGQSRQFGDSASRFTADTAATSRRKELYEILHPEARNGVAGTTARWDASAKLANAFSRDAADDAGRIARAVQIWTQAGPAQGTVVERYLASRGLALPDGDDVLRYHNATPWRDEAHGRTIYVPCMIAAMRAINGDEITAIHRTRLTPEGAKVDRRMLGIAAGAAVKIDGDDAVTMGLAIGEGVETVLAARQLGFRPAWALASAGAVAAFLALPGIEALTILAERDDTNARAVEACASRWHQAGREVVVIEPTTGSDLNDAMRGAA